MRVLGSDTSRISHRWVRAYQADAKAVFSVPKTSSSNLFKWTMPSPPVVRVNRKAADRVASGHPWIFASDVIDYGSAQAGDAVRVIDFKGRLLGTAHFSSSSQISLRLFTRHVEAIDETFLLKRVQAAIAFRQRIV